MRWTDLRRVVVVGAGAAGLLVFAALPGCGEDIYEVETEDGKFGSVLNDDEFRVTPIALPVEALTQDLAPIPLPASMRLANTPSVSMQGTATVLGSPGTCEAQSFAYGLGSYTAARNPDGSIKWAADVPANQVSAAYQYALNVKNGFAGPCPGGGLATTYLSRLAGFGSPNAAQVPYQPTCAYLDQINVDQPYPDIERLRIGSFATFFITNTPQTLARIKSYLANGQAVAFSGLVFKKYAVPQLTDGVFYDAVANLIPDSGHGQLLVGYDDTVGAAGNKGALLVQNSFGTAWPPAAAGSIAPPGKLFWSFETFLASQHLAAIAYPYDPSPPQGAQLVANVAAAPQGTNERAYQYSPTGSDVTFLIFIHHFASPIRILSVQVQEPAPGTAVAVGQYGQYLSKGYTYLRRADGREFLPGTYEVHVSAELLDGSPVTYTGNVRIGDAQPQALPPATVANPTVAITDTIGKPITYAQ